MVRNGLGHLGHTHKCGAENLQGVKQVRLIESLKRTGYYRPAAEIDVFHTLQIVLAGKSVGHESLIGNDGKILIDNVEMAIEVFLFTAQWSSPLFQSAPERRVPMVAEVSALAFQSGRRGFRFLQVVGSIAQAGRVGH